MSIETDQYKQLFIEEAKEHLGTLTQSLLILEKEPDNSEVINMLFRSAHTLKGSSGMMGYKDFQHLTHAMEDMFDGMRKGNKPTSSQVSVLLECVDALTERLENIQNNVDGEIDVEPFTGKLHEVATAPATQHPEETAKTVAHEGTPDFTSSEEAILKKAELEGEHCLQVKLKFTDDCAFKAIRAKMVIDKLEELVDVAKTLPAQENLTEENLGQGFTLFVAGKTEAKAIETEVHQILEIEKVEVSKFNCIVQRGKAEKERKDGKAASEKAENAKLLAEVRSAQTVRVKFEQLDNLMNLVGELVINKIALLEVSTEVRSESLKRITENIDRLTASLQGLVMQVRMVPVSQVFDRFPRLVRDLSLKKSKKINLVMEGREIEVDRSVLDEIGEPLIHLLRNSVDHGIEFPAERLEKGKPETGTIRLVTRPAEDNIIIEIEDDGAGINAEKVKQSALEKQLITKTDADRMSEEQLVNLIFLPGLSTAKQISETSGRGVGMDVVNTKIASLGGKVHVETHVGKGTKISIRLPSTLTIIKALLVKEANQVFAIPTGRVSEVVSVKKKDISSLGVFQAIRVRGKVLPFLFLHDLLNLPASEESENLEVMIVYGGGGNEKIGVAVNHVLNLQEILIKPLDETLKNIKGFGGVTMLGNGTVVLVLDLGPLITREIEKGRTQTVADAESAELQVPT